MKGDDPEIDTAQTPKRFDRCRALQERIGKSFTGSIPNNLKAKQVIVKRKNMRMIGVKAVCHAFDWAIMTLRRIGI